MQLYVGGRQLSIVMSIKRCAACSRPIPEDRRPDAKYCSPACQEKAKAKRKRSKEQ